MRKYIHSIGLASLLAMSGCAGSVRVPPYIGGYDVRQSGNALAGYVVDNARQFEEVLAHVFSLVDDGNRTIDRTEALQAMNILQPRLDEFRTQVLALKKPESSQGTYSKKPESHNP